MSQPIQGHVSWSPDFKSDPKPAFELPPNLFSDLVRKYQLAVETLTEEQLVEAIRQAILSGDFVRHVVSGSSAQSVVYLPWSEVERLRAQYDELLHAVASKHEGETRHETALRYILEREADQNLSAAVEATLPK